MEKYQEEFLARLKHHIDLVNKYAARVHQYYPYHDADKLGPLFGAYSLSKKYGQGYETYEGLSEDEAKIYNDATLKHILNNPHHPECWVDPKAVAGFTRDNPPMGLDCTEMSDAAILEMCCDWCAMSEEFDNTPFEWFNKTCGPISSSTPTKWRWLFSDYQRRVILEDLEEL